MSERHFTQETKEEAHGLFATVGFGLMLSHLFRDRTDRLPVISFESIHKDIVGIEVPARSEIRVNSIECGIPIKAAGGSGF